VDLAAFGLKSGDLLFFCLTAVVAASTSLAVFAACFYWFRSEQKRMQKRIIKAITAAGRRPEDMILTGSDTMVVGELVARVNHGRLVVSVLESDGKRFIHVNGELSPGERSKVVHYLKSEGFMS
jgi:protein-disulfide isomerase